MNNSNKFLIKSNSAFLFWLASYLDNYDEDYFTYINLDEMQMFIDELTEIYKFKYSDETLKDTDIKDLYIISDSKDLFKNNMLSFNKKCYYFLKGRINCGSNTIIRNSFPLPRPNTVAVTTIKLEDQEIPIYIRTKDTCIIEPKSIFGIQLGNNCDIFKLLLLLAKSDKNIDYSNLTKLLSNYSFNLQLRDKLVECVIYKLIYTSCNINIGIKRSHLFLRELKNNYSHINVEVPNEISCNEVSKCSNLDNQLLYKVLENKSRIK